MRANNARADTNVIADIVSDVVSFVAEWTASPKRVASVAPSSKALGELITCEIDSGSAPVIELGPGTGVFTRCLIERGIPEQDLTLIELGPEFARRLARRFPAAQVVQGDARRIGRMTLFDEDRHAGAVVSGLPLLSMPPRHIMEILSGCFRQLRPDGVFYQFTYGPGCPVPRAVLERLGLRATRIGRAWLNIPPAGVYRIVAD
ncbi:MAG TPA: methyltransferase domain-containing protein [Burkholderiaceae bacterium]|nr:methyltransferase domain-containing protein [Burkholderiaceae bacterium]